mmetsp:Transcript_16787/g.34607  ORF Transcript_16787/g.34607 Transcript_16787/m.34607 type:complete len:87 (+) Transcript_16787:1557-1817(+)
MRTTVTTKEEEKRKKMMGRSLREMESVHWLKKMTLLDRSVENCKIDMGVAFKFCRHVRRLLAVTDRMHPMPSKNHGFLNTVIRYSK